MEESDSYSCEMENESKSESSNIDKDLDLIKVLRTTWKLFIPPVAGESVLVKWYVVVCSTKCASQLFVCKIIKCFLVDENGSVDSLKVCCLIPKVGSVTLLDDTPSHLRDICLFNLANVIYSPLEVVPVRARKFSIPEYQEVVKHFICVKKTVYFALV